LFTGSTFTTPIISSTTTYYAAASTGGATTNMGRLVPQAAAGRNLTTYGQVITITEPVTLNAVDVISAGGTSITVTLYNNDGTTLLQNAGATTVTANTTQTITLNWALAPGTYRLMATGMTGNFIRENSTVTYPIALGSIGQVNGFVSSLTGTVTTSASYYWFYNMLITTGCESTPRTAVTATIDNSMGCVPFPVNLLSFKGEKNGNINALEWKTATELNNAGFELQRSADGNTFSAVTFIASKAVNGNSTGVLTYQFDDIKPINGNNYYRLKQIDKDGKATYSNVVLIRGNRMNQLVVSNLYPNPTKKDATLILNSPAADKVSIVITDVTGRVVFQKAASLITGDNLIQLPISQLGSGTYLVKCLCSNGCETAVKKLIKE